MAVTLEQFKKETASRERGRHRGPASYPQEMRRFAVEHGRTTKASGGSVSSSAKEFGVSEVTLSKWMRDGTHGGTSSFREVVVEQVASSTSSLVLVTRSGHRIEGRAAAKAAGESPDTVLMPHQMR